MFGIDILGRYEDKLIKYTKLNEYAQEPTRGSAAAAGYDLYAAISDSVTIPAHSTVKIGTGLAFALPDNTFAAIFARSGLATKQGLRPANCGIKIVTSCRGTSSSWFLCIFIYFSIFD